MNPPPTAAQPADPQTAMAAVIGSSISLGDHYHATVHAFRNRLVIITVIVVLAAALLVVVQWRLPTATIFVLPADNKDLSRWAVMLLIMLFGSAGALLTAIPAMAAIPTVHSPYNFPMQQAFVKVAGGGLSALIGVVAIGNPGVTSGFASLATLIGVAIVFGAGQQAVTRFLDKQAAAIISEKPQAQASTS